VVFLRAQNSQRLNVPLHARRPTPWLADFALLPRGLEYLRSQYFALTTLTGLGKMMHPNEKNEAFFSLITMLVGIIVVAYGR
jgi:hypothetical protein